MKKYGRTIIVIAVLVALGLGYYYYLANKDTGKMLLILQQIPVRFLCLFQKILWLIIRNHLRM